MKKLIKLFVTLAIVASLVTLLVVPVIAAETNLGEVTGYQILGNTMTFKSGAQEVKLEFCTPRTIRVQLSIDGAYRGEDPLYYMVQKKDWASVARSMNEQSTYYSIKTSDLEIRVDKNPLKIGMYELDGNLLSRDTDGASGGMYWDADATGNPRGVRRVEGTKDSGGIFGFGTTDHGRPITTNGATFNRYNWNMPTNYFTMAHGKLMAPFFMSTAGYGVFLNTNAVYNTTATTAAGINSSITQFFPQGGGFVTNDYLDYYFIYGPDFKTILNEYAEITGRQELYGKWAQGFMVSKYGDDNATQSEFLTWINRFRNEDYPYDCYVFDYGWRQNGTKWGVFNWDTSGRYPDLEYMFSEARRLGVHVGLHNNKGTPGANGGNLWDAGASQTWTDLHMNAVIKTGYGDWFWPDEFDANGDMPGGQVETYTRNYMPTFSAKGPYEAWKDYTVESRPLFVTRGSYAGQHYATSWSGDISGNVTELGQQITYHLNAGMVGYWATSHDLGGFSGKPSDALNTRWTAEFGTWNAIMRTHGTGGREPWLFDATFQNTLRRNLKIRYALYPYSYSLAWQGYSQGTPIMRPMVLEDNSQYNSAAYTLDRQYYYGDWFLVAPAAQLSATAVSVWLPPNTTWYNYYTGLRYEAGSTGRTISVGAALDDIPVFVKSGAIVPMGPAVNYADEKPLNPLTLDIYPKYSTSTSFTLYEDDGVSRRYQTENAYSTTKFDSVMNGNNISFKINAREDHNPDVYLPVERSYNLKFNHIDEVDSVTINGSAIVEVASLTAYNGAVEAYWLDSANNIVYVKTQDTGAEKNVILDTGGIVEPELGDETGALPLPNVMDGTVYDLTSAAKTNVSNSTTRAYYTGSGYVGDFTSVGAAAECAVNVLEPGKYNFMLRVSCGKNNNATDNSPRQGAIYVNNNKVCDFEFPVTDVWGTGTNGNGLWLSYELPGEYLDAGRNVITIRREGDINPGGYLLDSLTFIRKTTPAFAPIEAESAADITNGSVASDATCSGGAKITLNSGGFAKYPYVNGAPKTAVSIRARSVTGGQIQVWETSVGNKSLCTIDLDNNGLWKTYEVISANTDEIINSIEIELNGAGAGAGGGAGAGATCEIDWFQFETDKTVVNPYVAVQANSADYRYLINTSSKTTFNGFSGVNITFINNIEPGDYALYRNVDFGKTGPNSVAIRYASGINGKTGRVEFRLDSPGGRTIATVNTSKTSPGSSDNWDYMAYSPDVECAEVKGIHDLYVVFIDTISATSICDFASFQFKGDDVPLPTVQNGTVYDLSTGKLINVTVGTTWKYYTGAGYANAFYNVGDGVDCAVNVVQPGTYNFLLRANCGKKNDATDNSPRQGAIYVNDVKVSDFELPITDLWGTGTNGDGMWISYEIPGTYLYAGKNVISVKAAGDRNPGNYNLDSLTFVRKTIPAFAPINAAAASVINGGVIASAAECFDGSKLVLDAGGTARYAEVGGSQKTGLSLRAKSYTGGQIVVQENAVGGKVLATVDIEAGFSWKTYNLPSLNTDATISDIILEVRGAGAVCEIDWFNFETTKTTVNPYNTVQAQSASERFLINTGSKNFGGSIGTVQYCNNIEPGDYLVFRDVNFGALGPDTITIRYIAGIVGKTGAVNFRLDSVGGRTFATVNTSKTSPGASGDDWNTIAYSSAFPCEKVTGIHDLYVVFIDMMDARSICDFASFAFTQREAETVDYTTEATLNKSESTVIASFRIVNSSETDDLDAQCIIAEYNARGALVSVKSEIITAGKLDVAYWNISVPDAGNYVKAFIWRADTYAPLCMAAELDTGFGG